MKTHRYLATLLRSGTPPLDAAASETLAARFKALADPTRVAIVNRLAAAERVLRLRPQRGLRPLAADDLPPPQGLCAMPGSSSRRRRGTWAYYRLVPDAVRELRQTLGG